jgi:hypothetical protein
VAEPKPLQILRGHAEYVFPLVFRPDGRQLASGSSDGFVRIWDTATGRAVHAIKTHAGFIRGMGYSPRWSALGHEPPDGGSARPGTWARRLPQVDRYRRGHEVEMEEPGVRAAGATRTPERRGGEVCECALAAECALESGAGAPPDSGDGAP